MLSDLARCVPTYDPPDAAGRAGVPSSLVIKFAASTDAKGITETYGGYQQEIRFYREIAPALEGKLRLGPCLYTAMDPASSRYTLVMDDLSTAAVLKPGDQVAGCTVAQAVGAARSYARLHATFWESQDLDDDGRLGWVVRPTEARWDQLVSPFMVEHAGAAFLDQELPPAPDGSARKLVAPPGTKEMIGTIAAQWGWLNKEIESTPRTLCHWDSRTDNFFWDTTEPEAPVIIDWQMIQRQRGAHDIAMLLATSLPVELRRAHDGEILRAYHEELLANCVANYTYDAMYRDFRLGLMTASQHPAFAAVNLWGSNERAISLAIATVERFYSAMLDHKVVEELPEAAPSQGSVEVDGAKAASDGGGAAM
jgi:hypothetical protein